VQEGAHVVGVEGAHGDVGVDGAHELAPFSPGRVALGGAAIDQGDVDVGEGVVGAAAESVMTWRWRRPMKRSCSNID